MRVVTTSIALAAAVLAGCGGATTPTPEVPVETMPEDLGTVSPVADQPTPSDLADLVENLRPTVVNITTVITTASSRPSPFDFFFPGRPGSKPTPRQRRGAGTGFVVDGQGYIVTNAHVVDEAETVLVRLHDDRQVRARVVGRDRKLDLALLKMDGAGDLKAVTLGDSTALRVGETVIAVGNPFGLGHTVTTGIVSAKARTIGAGPYDDFIQTDASINPGNSGGPLFNRRGEVIGINTAIRAGADGIGFAIPVDALKDIIGQLRDKGFVERGKLGIEFQPVSAELAKALGLDRPRGAMVADVIGGSAADRAGLESGDVILAINDSPIRRAEELPRNVARHTPGSTIDIVFLRDGKQTSAKATLDLLEGSEGPPAGRNATGDETDGDDKPHLMGIDLVSDPEGGVRVRGMRRPYKGLFVGDLVVAVNGVATPNRKKLEAVIGKMKVGDVALFKVRRDDPRGGRHHRFVGVPLTE